MRWRWWLLASVSLVVAVSSSWVVFWYHRLDLKSQAVKKSWENVEEAYSQRFDVIPILAESAKSIYVPEREVFDLLAQSRQQFALANGPDQQVRAAEHIERALHKVTDTIADYPSLASQPSVVAALEQLRSSDEQLAQSVADYNQSVVSCNQALSQPGVATVAQLFVINPAQEFRLE